MDCVIICGGKSKRMGLDINKVLLPVKTKPILKYVVDYWLNIVDRYIFLTGNAYRDVERYINKLDIDKLIMRDVGLGSFALELLKIEDIVSDKFVIALGDCIQNGVFDWGNDFGCGVWNGHSLNDLERSYAVYVNDEKIYRVIEKPCLLGEIYNIYCGMGTYFFDKRIFQYIRQTKPSNRTKRIEFTDVIQTMIDSKEIVKPIYFKGEYINITYPEDIKKAEAMY